MKKFTKKHRENIGKAMKGKKLSALHKKHIKEGLKRSGKNKGWHHSKKAKKKLSELASLRTGSKNSFYGRKHSDRTKKLIAKKKKENPSRYWLGKKKSPFSKAWRDNMSLSHLGKKNPAYIDGRRSNGQYYPYEFKVIREKIRKRDGYKCQLCGKTQKEELKKLKRKLSIHHIDYNTSNYKEKDLISLCSKCNSKVNFHRKKWAKFFKNLISKRIKSWTKKSKRRKKKKK